MFPDILDMTVTALIISVLKPAAEETFPEVNIAEEYTGMKLSIKSEHSPITLTEDSTAFFIGTRKTEAAERAVTAFIIFPVWEKFSQKLFVREQIIIAAVIEKIALNGSFIFLVKLSPISIKISFTESEEIFS